MVFFSCDGCGGVLKKSQVDGHASRCRRCESVSCVDCNVSFFGDDFRQHTSCLTEVERYEKRAPTKKNGKVAPQQLWMDLISDSVDQAPAHLRSHLHVMANLDNVPRKEKQFRNFAANSLNLNGSNSDKQRLVGEIWTFLAKRREQAKEQDQTKQQSTKQPEQKVVQEPTPSPSPSPPPEAESSDKQTGSSSEKNGSKNAKDKAHSKLTAKTVKKAMKKALKKEPTKSLTIKALRKLLKTQLEANDKDELKKLVKENAKAHFLLDGKTVRLA